MRKQLPDLGDFEQRRIWGGGFSHALNFRKSAQRGGDCYTLTGATPQSGRDFCPGAVLSRRENTGVAAGRVDRRGHQCAARHDDIIANAQVAIHHRRATQHAASADDCAASNANATGNRGVIADAAVVSNLYEIVYLDPIANDRIVDRAPVNGRVGTDFHVATDDDTSHLLYLLPAPPRRLKAKTVGTDDRSTLDNAAITNFGPGANAHTCMDDAISTDDNIVANAAVAGDEGTDTNP